MERSEAVRDAAGADAGTVPGPARRVDPARIIDRARELGLTLATAESLTGGAVVARLVDVPGASAVVAGGAACYSYEAKHRVLGVDPDLLARTGAVTVEVAGAMVRGVLDLYRCDLAVATTGVAGPGPDERGVPAGTVVLACGRADGTVTVREVRLSGDRARVRAAAVEEALGLLLETLD